MKLDVMDQQLLLLEHLQEGVWSFDEHGYTSYVSRRMAALLGARPAELTGSRLEEFIPDPLPLGDEKLHLETELTNRRGERLYVELTGGPVWSAENRRIGYILSCIDHTVEHRLSESHRILAEAVEQSQQSVLITDADARIQYVNPAFTRVTGYTREEVIGGTPSLLKSGEHDQDFYRSLWNTIAGGQVWKGNLINRRKDGSLYTEESTIMPVRDGSGQVRNYLGLKSEVSRNLEIERNLRFTQKLEALGALAGGIAHDFNNMLMVILGYADLAETQVEDQSPAREHLTQIRTAGRRARDLADRLLTFSRSREGEPTPVRITPVVKEAAKLTRSTIPAHIAVNVDLTEPVPVVRADPTQMHQLVLNLCVNAGRAMEHMDSGELRIILRSAVFGEEDELPPRLSTTGTYLYLGVSDTGTGIDPEIAEHIFEPFFTTRPSGEGTGLGLAVVHGIVTRSGGTITFDSEPGRGTLFEVYLPATEENTEAPRGEASTSVDEPDGGRVLFVDDEAPIADIAHRVLSRAGFTVTTCTDPEEAAEVLVDSEEESFDLVVTDISMPKLPGDRLAEIARRHHPRLPVLGCTGYSGRVDEHTAGEMGFAELLYKPLEADQLIQAVSRNLRKETSTEEDET
ncbi:MAG: PAS domain S-box protein [Spirochaetaceae bacterium]